MMRRALADGGVRILIATGGITLAILVGMLLVRNAQGTATPMDLARAPWMVALVVFLVAVAVAIRVRLGWSARVAMVAAAGAVVAVLAFLPAEGFEVGSRVAVLAGGMLIILIGYVVHRVMD